MKEAFKPGDIVQLKSGGPSMTVDEISNYGVRAVWFAYGKWRRQVFVAAALQPAEARVQACGKRLCAPASA